MLTNLWKEDEAVEITVFYDFPTIKAIKKVKKNILVAIAWNFKRKRQNCWNYDFSAMKKQEAWKLRQLFK